MTSKNEIIVLDIDRDIVEDIRVWGKALCVGYMLGENTAESTDDVRKVVDMIARLRETHDEAAKEQGNATVRKTRTDKGTAEVLTADELKAKAIAKAEALFV